MRLAAGNSLRWMSASRSRREGGRKLTCFRRGEDLCLQQIKKLGGERGDGGYL